MENNTTKSFYNTSIPSDWEIVNSGQVIKYFGGNAFNSDDNCATGIKWLKIANVGIENTKWDEVSFLPKEFINTFKKYLLKEGDVVMALTRPILDNKLKVAQIKEVDIPCLLNQRVAKLITKQNLYIKFAYHLVQMPYFINRMNVAMAGTDPPNLGSGDLEKIKISLPPIPEQCAISHILGLMDTAINQNNQLIAQKELRKKWLMQNLLTGKKRLKGFEGEWKEIHIRDISKEVSMRNKADKQLTVLSCTKHNGLVESLEYWGRKIFADDISTYKIVPKNHFAYATNHIEEGSIGYQEILDEALISPMYTVFKTDSTINDLFFYKLLKSHKLIYQYQNRMEGSIDRRGGLRWDAFSIIKIHLPSYEEQTAIAKVLQAAGKEIQLLKSKTDKLREQKKGMMQVLLTGKKRLKIN